jgi:hexulose-6-phosphate isomerase
MIKACSYWMVEGGLEGKRPVEEAMEDVQRAGFEGIELGIAPGSALTERTGEKRCKQIVRFARRLGLKITSCATGLYWGCSLTSNKASEAKRALQFTERALSVVQRLGAKAFLVIPGIVEPAFASWDARQIVPYDECYKRAVAQMKRIARTATKLKVQVGCENVWNKFLLSPLEMRQFIDAVGSRYVGSYFDLGNHRFCGYPDQWIRILGRRIKRVHIKDYKYPGRLFPDDFPRLGRGDVDFAACMKALVAVGYNGPITAEILEIPWQKGVLRHTSRAMDKILAAAPARRKRRKAGK